MEEIIIQFILIAVEQAIQSAIEGAINYVIRKVVDETGRWVTEIVYQIDSDGDGVTDTEQTVYTLDAVIPDMDTGYCLCNDGDQVGIGFPTFEIVDGTTVGDIFNGDQLTGGRNGWIVDADGDGEFDVLVPLLTDLTGDGVSDWGKVIDRDNNGLPDASPDLPFYPVGSDGYDQIAHSSSEGVDIVLVSSDGEIAVYDRNGNIKAEDVDNAYTLWVSENNIMDKHLDNYSVTEGLLLLMLLVSVAFFIRSLFKRKDYYR